VEKFPTVLEKCRKTLGGFFLTHTVQSYKIGSYRISARAIFAEIRASPAPAKFLAGFGGRWCSCSTFKLTMHKTNTAHLSSGVFTVLISVTQTIKIQDSLPFHKFPQ